MCPAYGSMQAIIEHSSFDANRARWGGAVSLVEQTRLHIHNCTFSRIEAGFSGGAIDADDECAVNVTLSSFTSNSAADQGGALALACEQSAVISSIQCTNNTVTGRGGCVYIALPVTAFAQVCCVTLLAAVASQGLACTCVQRQHRHGPLPWLLPQHPMLVGWYTAKSCSMLNWLTWQLLRQGKAVPGESSSCRCFWCCCGCLSEYYEQVTIINSSITANNAVASGSAVNVADGRVSVAASFS
ncbi:hypothetical protein COO60DRAFT_424235 [Scenedesmus sp. NREL 46B-D3]|nr:hypothetical protein COO60DRAFT_424235 [Scenedesmus sp. NREL 46B-D3]